MSYIIAIRARSTHRSRLANAASKPGFAHQWARSVIVTKTRCARASSQRSSANSSIVRRCAPTPRRSLPSSTSLRDGMSRIDGIPRSITPRIRCAEPRGDQTLAISHIGRRTLGGRTIFKHAIESRTPRRKQSAPIKSIRFWV